MDGSVATRAAAATVSDACTATDAAAAAFPAWAALSPNARRGYLDKAAAELKRRTGDFDEQIRSEIGATQGWAQFKAVLTSIVSV